ncbi:MAG: hypothetical protein AABW57_02275 [Nanoarchaeota archaeon]
MVEREYITPTNGIKIKWGRPTDLKELYRQMKIWLEDNGFAQEATLEKKYVEMIKPSGKDIFILWEAGKDVSDYFSYKIIIQFLLVAANEIEVQEGALKRKLMRGTLEVDIIAYVEYGKNWENLGALNKIYKKLIAKSRLEDYSKDLYDKVYKFQKFIKDFIGLTA